MMCLEENEALLLLRKLDGCSPTIGDTGGELDNLVQLSRLDALGDIKIGADLRAFDVNPDRGDLKSLPPPHSDIAAAAVDDGDDDEDVMAELVFMRIAVAGFRVDADEADGLGRDIESNSG